MIAGRELDALVATHVMHWREYPPPCPACKADGRMHYERAGMSNCLPRFSTSIAAAWEVVEKMLSRAALDHIQTETDGWHVQFCAKTSAEPWWHEHAVADTAPLAICLAALRAVGYRDDEVK